MAAQPRALFVIPHCPSPNALQAGHKTAFHFLCEIADTHDVDLVIFSKSTDIPHVESVVPLLRSKAKSVTVIPISAFARASGWLLGLFLGLAPRFCTRLSFGAMAEFKRIVARAPKYDLVWSEFSQSFWVAKLFDAGTDVRFSLHDVQTQVVSSKSSLEQFLTLGFTYQSEKTLLTRATHIRVQSINDSWLLHSLFRVPMEKIELKEPALSSFLTGVARSLQTIEPHSLLFWGAMARPENSDAIISFIKDHFGNLKREYSDAKLYVVGSNPPEKLLALAGNGIVVTGFVDDPRPYFERAGLGIAPLTRGAGIKVKVLEMLRTGMPVMSSPIGAEGIASDTLLMTVESCLFGEAIRKFWLSQDKALH